MALPIFASQAASKAVQQPVENHNHSIKRYGDAIFDQSDALHSQRFLCEPEPLSALEEENAEERTKSFQAIVKQIATLQTQLVEAHEQQVSGFRNEIGRLKANGIGKPGHHPPIPSSPQLRASDKSLKPADKGLRHTAEAKDCLSLPTAPTAGAPAAPAPSPRVGKKGFRAFHSMRSGWRQDAAGHRMTLHSRTARITYRESTWLLQPNGCFVRYWEVLVMVSLIFTGIVSPVEVAFMENNCQMSLLMVLNQVINGIFLIDMILQFFTVWETKLTEGSRSIKDPVLIAKHYLKTWFAVDLASVIPFDTFGCLFNSESLRKMKAARFVRLIRLLKLVRLMRGSRIVANWQVNNAFPYKEQTLGKFVCVVIMGAHWMSCLWGLVGLESTAYSWVDALADGKPHGMYLKRHPIEKREPGSLYLASLHYAFMTITSIGYGDIVPQQDAEYVVSVLCQLCGGLLWAYGISEVIAVVSNLDPGGTQFRRTMDDLNHMMKVKHLDHNLQVRLRSFFLQARELHDQERYCDLLCRMSPQLMSDVARVTNVQWIKRVWYLKPRTTTEAHLAISDHFIAQIAVALRARVCSQGETLRSDATLRVLVRGLAGQTGKVLSAGDVWGEDFILETRSLRIDTLTACLTFIEIQTMTRRIFQEVLAQSGTRQDSVLIRKAVVKLAFMRGVQRLARAELARAHGLMSVFAGGGAVPERVPCPPEPPSFVMAPVVELPGFIEEPL